jgi:hypothetical protein
MHAAPPSAKKCRERSRKVIAGWPSSIPHLKALRFPERLSALAEGRLAAPAHVRIKPTNVCNRSCVADAKNRLPTEYLEFDPAHLGFV